MTEESNHDMEQEAAVSVKIKCRRAHHAALASQHNIHVVPTSLFYNRWAAESFLVLDCCAEPVGSASPGAVSGTDSTGLPGSVWLSTNRPVAEAAAHARELAMTEMTPDVADVALLLYDDEVRMEEVARWLVGNGCARVEATARSWLVREFGFLFDADALQLVLPTAIVDGGHFPLGLGRRALLLILVRKVVIIRCIYGSRSHSCITLH